MPAAPEHAPHLRIVPWLLAGGIALGFGAVLMMAAWYALPIRAPDWVRNHSPWAGPVVRVAMIEEGRSPGQGWGTLAAWGMQEGRPYMHLAPLLSSPDLRVRRMVTNAFAVFGLNKRLQAIDSALLPLLNDQDEEIRICALVGLSQVTSIPVLEAHLADGNRDFVEAVQKMIGQLRKPSSVHTR